MLARLPSTQPPCVLIVDDDEVDRRFVQRAVRNQFVFLEADNELLAISLIRTHTPDCVLLDYHIPGANAMAILEACVQSYIPMVVLSGVGNETIAAEAIKSGATDYLPKTMLSQASLTRAITNAIEKGILERLLHEKQQELETFVATAAHDLKAPLRTVVTQCQLAQLLTQETLEPEAQQALATAIMAANSLFDLVQNLLDYTESGRSTKPFEPVDLETLARQVVADLDTIISDSDALVEIAPLPTIQGDATGLRQLLQNLIGNALKFQNHERPHVQVTAVQEEAWWQIRVSDNGIGIEPEVQKQIFQPLTRLHAASAYEGSGLGLAICNKIAHLHQGTIRVESALGRGSTFVLNLPATATSEG